MPRSISHTMSFTFTGVDALTPVTSKVIQSIDAICSAFGRIASSANYAIKRLPVLQGAMAALGPTANSVAGTVRPVANAIAAAARTSSKGAGGLKELAGAYNALIVAKRVASIMAGAVKPAADLEMAQAELSVATGVSGENLKKLVVSAKAAAAATLFTPTEAISAYKTLNLSIRDVNTTSEAGLPTLMLAQTYFGKDVPAAAKTASLLLGAFNLKGSDLVNNLDKMVAGALAAGVPVAMLSEGFGKLGVAAAAVKSSFEGIYPAYLLAIKGGLTATEAGTGLKTAMMRLADPKVRGELERSLDVVVERGGQFLPVRDVVLQLAAAAKKSAADWVSVSFAIKKAFGDRAAKPIIIAIEKINKGILDQQGQLQTGASAWDFMSEAMAASSGMLAKSSEEAMKPLSAQVELLKEQLDMLLGAVFAPLLPILTSIVRVFTWLFDTIRSAFTDLGWFSDVLCFIVKIVGDFSAVVGTALIAMLAWAAATRIGGVAFGFLLSTGGRVSQILLRTITYLFGVTTAQTAAARAGVTLSGSFVTTGVAAKGMWRAILGPAIIALMVFEAIYQNWAWIKGLMGFSADDAVKKKKELAGSASLHTVAVNESKTVISGLSDATLRLAETVRSAEAARKQELPVASGKVIADVASKIAELKKSGDLAGPGLSHMEAAYREVIKFQDEYAKSLAGVGELKTESIDRAQVAMSYIGTAMTGLLPAETKFIQSVHGVATQLEKTKGTEPLTAAYMSVYDKERERHRQLSAGIRKEADLMSAAKGYEARVTLEERHAAVVEHPVTEGLRPMLGGIAKFFVGENLAEKAGLVSKWDRIDRVRLENLDKEQGRYEQIYKVRTGTEEQYAKVAKEGWFDILRGGNPASPIAEGPGAGPPAAPRNPQEAAMSMAGDMAQLVKMQKAAKEPVYQPHFYVGDEEMAIHMTNVMEKMRKPGQGAYPTAAGKGH